MDAETIEAATIEAATIEAEISSSVSTKITVIVFWGLVVIGLCFTSILLHKIKQYTLESQGMIADSIAYNISAITQSDAAVSALSEKSVSKNSVILFPHTKT